MKGAGGLAEIDLSHDRLPARSDQNPLRPRRMIIRRYTIYVAFATADTTVPSFHFIKKFLYLVASHEQPPSSQR